MSGKPPERQGSPPHAPAAPPGTLGTPQGPRGAPPPSWGPWDPIGPAWGPWSWAHGAWACRAEGRCECVCGFLVLSSCNLRCLRYAAIQVGSSGEAISIKILYMWCGSLQSGSSGGSQKNSGHAYPKRKIGGQGGSPRGRGGTAQKCPPRGPQRSPRLPQAWGSLGKRSPAFSENPVFGLRRPPGGLPRKRPMEPSGPDFSTSGLLYRLESL
jgi:hypothetical protein